MASLKEKSISLLISAAAIDVNNAAKQSIFVCPSGKSCVVTHVVIRNVSAGLTTNSLSFGWNTNANDFIPTAVYATLTGSTLYTLITAMPAATRGTSAGVFGVIANVTGAAATATIDVFGYLY